MTVGITEDSTVSIGTVSQTFDLDISALVSSDSSSGSSQTDSMSGGMGMQMFSFGESSYTSQSQEMEIDSVHITVGQEIQAGDEVEVDFDSGIITDVTTGKKFQGQAFPPFMQKIIDCEGLVNYINQK